MRTPDASDPSRGIRRVRARPQALVHRKPAYDAPVRGSNVVDAAIRSLRKKLGAHASAIETVKGFGYRFRAGSVAQSLP